ncbi:MAG: hypothetical protein KDE09_02265 [Anaerolineales bacterium]|nr:hypothetical protein [Anaerolineales bacterium]MCB0011202.1 hypothetical protein [Anaerolineales bacterium]MCB0016581.1 hypothetical protein [Anaerolineales bacterium]
MDESRRNQILTWGIIIVLLIGSGLAAAFRPQLANLLGGGGGGPAPLSVHPAESEAEMVTIDFDNYLLGADLNAMDIPPVEWVIEQFDGKSYPLWQVLAFLTVVVAIGPVVTAGLLVTGLYRFLDRFTTNTKEDESFKTAVATLEEREKEFVKTNMELKPPGPIPSHELPRWSVVSTTIIYFFFAVLIGGMLAATFDGPVGMTGLLFGLLVLLLCAIYFYFRPRRLYAVDQTDYQATNWGVLWVVVSGAVFVGVGLGVMAAVISAGG